MSLQITRGAMAEPRSEPWRPNGSPCVPTPCGTCFRLSPQEARLEALCGPVGAWGQLFTKDLGYGEERDPGEHLLDS